MRANRRVTVLQKHLLPEVNGPTTINPTASSAASYRGLLHNQVAVITGSGQGVGASAAKLFASEGASVVVTDIDATKSDAVAAEIEAAGGRAISFPGDVLAEDFPAKLIAATLEAFGKLHILVNNAGYTWDAVLHKTTTEQWNAMLAVHCTAPFRLIQAAEPAMRGAAKEELAATGKAMPRCILNVSSTSGVHGNAGQANYSTAKMGIVGLTKTIAKEWGGFNIRCNVLVFGAIKTRLIGDKTAGATMDIGGKQVALGIPGGADPDDMAIYAGCPMKRAGEPKEAAGSLLILACEHASYINGVALEVTGGSFL
ncbi:hypothetical protein CYMTET_43208 [Cymbomonas tetramitiformis]|uniref:Uncharacterized protein n=1 Tax=Cymbomonas tetramitiformis TaxID=36881 RepID=A0AAE0C2I9_9CHLO|nr:hypothetical protein CYMTET_43208 [Cymbomonas tetramitiformis]